MAEQNTLQTLTPQVLRALLREAAEAIEVLDDGLAFELGGGRGYDELVARLRAAAKE